MFRKFTPLLCCFLPFFAGAQPFEAVYSFANVSNSSGTVAPGPLPEVQGLALHSFSAHGVSSDPTASGRFSFKGWPTGAIDGENNYSFFNGALSPFSYYELHIQVSAGYSLTLSEMLFSVRRSGTGIRNYCVRTSIDNFATNMAAFTGTSAVLTVIPEEVFFWNNDAASTSSDQHGSRAEFPLTHGQLTGELFIRIYAWNAEAAGGSFSIDNVRLRGTIYDLTNGIDLQALCEPVISVDAGYVKLDCAHKTLQLLNANGSLLREEIEPEQGIKIGDLASGLYFVIFTEGDKRHCRKLMLLKK